MLRSVMALGLAVLMTAGAQGALLAKYEFTGNFNATSVNGGVTASAITPVMLSGVPQMSVVGDWGRSTAGGGMNTTIASFTIATAIAKPILFETVSVKLRRPAGPPNAVFTLINNVNGQVFTATTNNSTQSLNFNFAPSFSASSVTFSIQRQGSGGTGPYEIDDLEINGIIPEPASMAVFAVLSGGLLVYRRRSKVS